MSYLIGDDASGTAAVIDPRPDCEIYLELARRHGLAITHAFETHIHADFLSGARELVARCGEAKLCVSAMGDAEYGYEPTLVRDGDRFVFGSVVLRALWTPGHTPEHLSYLVSEADHPDEPWGVFTGDALFVGSAGRPDLVHDERGDALPDQLFDTLCDVFAPMDRGIVVLPGHGSGSGCGANIGDRPLSTIGYELRHNAFLQHDDREKFKAFLTDGAQPEPTHYRRLKKVNGDGAPVLGHLPTCPALPPKDFQEALDRQDTVLLDVHSVLAFGGSHIPGAMSIANRPELSNWAGWLLDADRPLLLVLDDDRDLDRVRRRLWRVGLTRLAGYLAGGMTAWIGEGRAVKTLPQWDVHELRGRRSEVQVLDVRADDEFEAGHVPEARHIHLPELTDRLDELDRERGVATFCGSGYRANIAASLLQRAGFPMNRGSASRSN
jgi:hydroxyacylglutathione hydrolase